MSNRKQEQLFHHRKGIFTGYVMRNDGKGLIQVKMTSNQPRGSRRPDYEKGEMRWIREDCPKGWTGNVWPHGVVEEPIYNCGSENGGDLLSLETWRILKKSN